jgi:hypothetical protein
MEQERIVASPTNTHWLHSELRDTILQAEMYLEKHLPSGYEYYDRENWPKDIRLFSHRGSGRMLVHFDSADAYQPWRAHTGRGPEVYAYRLMLWFNRVFLGE